MTVAQLIEELKRAEPEQEVYIGSYGNFAKHQAREVDLNFDKDVLIK